MKASEYLQKKNRSSREAAELYERKNWHLTQFLGSILYSSPDPEAGFTFPEADLLSVDPGDVEFLRVMDDKGKWQVTLRIKDPNRPKAAQ